MKESIYTNYKNRIRYDSYGDISHFYGHEVKVRKCGKLRVAGSKILTRILNCEL